jgi:hypothetical protein
MTSKQVRDGEDSKVEPRSRSRCPEVHGASMSQRGTTALSSAFVKDPLETWLLLVLVSGLGFQPSASRCTRRLRRRGPHQARSWLDGVEMPSSCFGGRSFEVRVGADAPSAQPSEARLQELSPTSSLFSDQRDAGSFSTLWTRVLTSRTPKSTHAWELWAHCLTILCLLSLLPRICNPMTIP